MVRNSSLKLLYNHLPESLLVYCEKSGNLTSTKKKKKKNLRLAKYHDTNRSKASNETLVKPRPSREFNRENLELTRGVYHSRYRDQ